MISRDCAGVVLAAATKLEKTEVSPTFAEALGFVLMVHTMS
jgi:hypothetical protein